MLALLIAAPYILPFIIKEGDVTRAILGMRILSLGLLFSFQNTIFGALYNSSHNEKRIVWPVTMGTILNIGLNFILIPYFGLLGAAITTALTELIVFIFFLTIYHRRIKNSKPQPAT